MNKLKRYAELKKIIFEAEREIKALKADVSTLVFEADNERVETEWGKFELREGRKTWEYSDELLIKEKKIKERIKLMKKEEEITGVAKLQKAPVNLVFTPRKEK